VATVAGQDNTNVAVLIHPTPTAGDAGTHERHRGRLVTLTGRGGTAASRPPFRSTHVPIGTHARYPVGKLAGSSGSLPRFTSSPS
jgi:hypothetical protein